MDLCQPVLVIEGTVWKNDFWSVWFGKGKIPTNANYGSLGAASSTNSGGNISATIIVHQYLKGDGSALIEITGFSLLLTS